MQRLIAILAHRCPLCLQGPIFRSLLTMYKNCPHCGVLYEREHGYFLNSMFIGYQKFEGPDRWRNPPDILHPNGVARGGTETKMGSFKLVWLPTDDLRVSFRYSDAKDHDAPTLSHFLTPSQRNGVYTQTRTTCVGTTCVAGPPIPAYYFTGTLNFNYSGAFPNGSLNLDQEPNPDYYN